MDSGAGPASCDSQEGSDSRRVGELARQVSDLQTFVAEGLAGLEGHWTDRSSRLEIEFLEAVTELHERVDSVIRHLRGLEFRLRVLEGRGENTDPPDLDSLDRWTSSFGLRLAYSYVFGIQSWFFCFFQGFTFNLCGATPPIWSSCSSAAL